MIYEYNWIVGGSRLYSQKRRYDFVVFTSTKPQKWSRLWYLQGSSFLGLPRSVAISADTDPERTWIQGLSGPRVISLKSLRDFDLVCTKNGPRVQIFLKLTHRHHPHTSAAWLAGAQTISFWEHSDFKRKRSKRWISESCRSVSILIFKPILPIKYFSKCVSTRSQYTHVMIITVSTVVLPCRVFFETFTHPFHEFCIQFIKTLKTGLDTSHWWNFRTDIFKVGKEGARP